jgi:hypothetical protein
MMIRLMSKWERDSLVLFGFGLDVTNLVSDLLKPVLVGCVLVLQLWNINVSYLSVVDIIIRHVPCCFRAVICCAILRFGDGCPLKRLESKWRRDAILRVIDFQTLQTTNHLINHHGNCSISNRSPPLPPRIAQHASSPTHKG